MIGAPSVLLLDDPTAGLDAWKEDVVREAMIEKRPEGQTVVCVAHALSTIRDADFILFVGEDGTIKEQGTWDELVNTHGVALLSCRPATWSMWPVDACSCVDSAPCGCCHLQVALDGGFASFVSIQSLEKRPKAPAE